MPILGIKQIRSKLLSYLRNHEFERKLNRLWNGLPPYSIGFGLSGSLGKALEFCSRLNVDGHIEKYRYAFLSKQPILYASVYAALHRHLLGDLRNVAPATKRDWATYINSFQCSDGLYRDPFLQNEIAETEDWWGWRHLSAQVVTALTILDTKTKIIFRFLEPLYEKGKARQWIESLNWEEQADFSSNAVMNYGVMLQYNRDFHGVEKAGTALGEIFSWLDQHQDPKTGLWGRSPFDTPRTLSIGVQTAYHIWILYFYERRTIQFIERCIDSCLKTQNQIGGFGVSLNSSACEDIDSIDPLCRFYFLSNYRRDDIRAAVERAISWIFANQNQDGGFVFKRFEPLAYGHELMTTRADESAMFPTWFRVLSLAYISRVIPNHPVFRHVDFHFIKCPGYQFWYSQ